MDLKKFKFKNNKVEFKGNIIKINTKRVDSTEFKKNRYIIMYGKYPEKPLCRCGVIATEVHHIDLNHNNSIMENLEAICRSCHLKKQYPGVERKIPYGGGAWRKNRRIIEMTHKEVLSNDDFNYLNSVSWGGVFIDAWFNENI